VTTNATRRSGSAAGASPEAAKRGITPELLLRAQNAYKESQLQVDITETKRHAYQERFRMVATMVGVNESRLG
jgi:hypothetical protein